MLAAANTLNFAKRATGRGRGQGTTTVSAQAPLVAVIEDEEDIRDALEMCLADLGYRVRGFADGRAAFEALDAGERPDLIILDLMMPRMDGWSFRVAQKARPELRDIPVVALSADLSSKAAAIDADAFLPKPIDIPRLTATIEQLLAAAERKRLMAKSIELERLRALGMLVGTVAHEVNNPLMYIEGNLELAREACQRLRAAPEWASVADALEKSLDAAQEGARHIAQIVESLLTFARSEHSSEGTADPEQALDAACRLAALSIRYKARIVRTGDRLPRVLGNEARLAQVFVNLLVNAGHAIEGGPETNTIEIHTAAHGDRVSIEVTDTGSGIHPEVLPHIFEPFFTTRGAGSGVGLGLSISKSFIESFGGTLSVRSTWGQGSTFHVELRVAKAAAENAPEDASAQRTGETRRAGQRYTVWIIDDDQLVGDLMRHLLPEHEVKIFKDPQRALAELSHAQVDLVLSDWLMPGMTGADFYAALCACRPDLAKRFGLMSGAAPNPDLQQFAHKLAHPVLVKPFSKAILRAFVRDAVEEAARWDSQA